MFKCAFCDQQVAQIEEEELSVGWHRLEGSSGSGRVRVVSCPDHSKNSDLRFDEFFKRMRQIEPPRLAQR